MTATKLARALGLIAATVILSAGIAACGGGGGGDDKAKVEGTVHDLYNGFALLKCLGLSAKSWNNSRPQPRPDNRRERL